MNKIHLRNPGAIKKRQGSAFKAFPRVNGPAFLPLASANYKMPTYLRFLRGLPGKPQTISKHEGGEMRVFSSGV